MNTERTMIETRRAFPLVARLIVPLLGIFFLVYPNQELWNSGASPGRLALALGGTLLFAGIFLWLMWGHEPLRLVPAGPSAVFRYRLIIGALLMVAVFMSYAFGQEWRMLFFYHINVAAGIMLPRTDAYVVIAGIAALTFVGGITTGFAWLAIPALAIGLWSVTFVGQVAAVAQLRAAREELARLAVTQERLRFARDLHDLLGHSLSLITLKSELAGRLLPDTPDNERAAGELRDLQGVARGALREVREAVSGYRSPSLKDEIEGARQMLEAAGISCFVHSEPGLLHKDAESVLTWVVREGVTNVVRHSGARRCEIRITREGSRIRAEVIDDGRGRVPKDGLCVDGSGLRGLAERVEDIGGRFEVEPLPDRGFSLRITLYLEADDTRETNLRSPTATGEHSDREGRNP